MTQTGTITKLQNKIHENKNMEQKQKQTLHLEVINALISISAFDVESISRNLDMFLRWKKCSFTDARDMAFK